MKISINVRVDKELRDRLDKLAQVDGGDLSYIVKWALRAGLPQVEKIVREKQKMTKGRE